MAKLSFVGQVIEIYKNEENGNQHVTASDTETGGVMKITAGPGVPLKEGGYYKFDVDVKGTVGKGFRFFMEYRGGSVKPLNLTISEG